MFIFFDVATNKPIGSFFPVGEKLSIFVLSSEFTTLSMKDGVSFLVHNSFLKELSDPYRKSNLKKSRKTKFNNC